MSLEEINLYKRNKYVLFFISLSYFLCKFLLINFGNPYVFQTDEIYIYKDSIKLIDKIINGDLNFTGNIYNYLLSIWYAILFALGFLLKFWNSVEDLKNQLLCENFIFFFWGRLLSVIFTLIANILFARLFIKERTKIFIIVSFLLFLNPLEWLCSHWVKFDGLCYLLTYYIVDFMLKLWRGEVLSSKYKILLFAIAISIRIDFICIPFAYYVYRLIRRKRTSEKYSFKSDLIEIIITGLIFLIATNKLIHFLYKKFGNVTTSSLEKPFEDVIIKRLSLSLQKPLSFLGHLQTNSFLYITIFLVIFLPCFILIKKRELAPVFKNSIYYFSLTLFVMFLYDSAVPHYLLPVSVTFLVLMLKNTQLVSNFRNLLIVAIWITSLTISFILHIIIPKDSRIIIAEHILAETNSSDIIAIESYQNTGLMPPIFECSDSLTKKGNYLYEKNGAGSSFIAKSKIKNKDCRSIIELDKENRFGKNSITKFWINPFVAENLFSLNPKFIIKRVETDKNYQTFIDSINVKYLNYQLPLPKIIDPRLKIISQNECFFKKYSIFKRKD